MTNSPKMHWMVSALLVMGAWISALFFLLVSWLLTGWRMQPLHVGSVFIMLAAVLVWVSRRMHIPLAFSAFLGQLELAFSLFGKALFCLGILEHFNLEPGGVFAVLSAVAAVGYPLFRQKADRALSVCAALCAGIVWPLLSGFSFPDLLFETCAVAAFVGAYVLLLRNKEAEAPFAWALLGACAFASGVYLFKATFFMPWLNPLLLGAALCIVYAFYVQGPANGWIMAGILLLCLLGNTGIVLGGALIALGFAQKRLGFKIIGAAAMYASLIWLYYSMHATLLVKSYYLGAAGLVLLGAYAWLKKGEKNA